MPTTDVRELYQGDGSKPRQRNLRGKALRALSGIFSGGDRS
jgi:hypothetical protein